MFKRKWYIMNCEIAFRHFVHVLAVFPLSQQVPAYTLQLLLYVGETSTWSRFFPNISVPRLMVRGLETTMIPSIEIFGRKSDHASFQSLPERNEGRGQRTFITQGSAKTTNTPGRQLQTKAIFQTCPQYQSTKLSRRIPGDKASRRPSARETLQRCGTDQGDNTAWWTSLLLRIPAGSARPIDKKVLSEAKRL